MRTNLRDSLASVPPQVADHFQEEKSLPVVLKAGRKAPALGLSPIHHRHRGVLPGWTRMNRRKTWRDSNIISADATSMVRH